MAFWVFQEIRHLMDPKTDGHGGWNRGPSFYTTVAKIQKAPSPQWGRSPNQKVLCCLREGAGVRSHDLWFSCSVPKPHTVPTAAHAAAHGGRALVG